MDLPGIWFISWKAVFNLPAFFTATVRSLLHFIPRTSINLARCFRVLLCVAVSWASFISQSWMVSLLLALAATTSTLDYLMGLAWTQPTLRRVYIIHLNWKGYYTSGTGANSNQKHVFLTWHKPFVFFRFFALKQGDSRQRQHVFIKQSADLQSIFNAFLWIRCTFWIRCSFCGFNTRLVRANVMFHALWSLFTAWCVLYDLYDHVCVYCMAFVLYQSMEDMAWTSSRLHKT